MILNGKALDDFYIWWENKIKTENFQYFKPREDVFLNALIIEFFDSVGIYISIRHLYDGNNWQFEVETKDETIQLKRDRILKRNTATIQAIKKANDIYNERISL